MSNEKENEVCATCTDETTKPATKPAKKSWFNRVWSAVTGLIVGVAAMFGVNKAQVAEIKSEVQTAYEKVQNVQTAIENKDFAGAIGAVTDAAAALKEVIGDVKDTANTVKENLEAYVDEFETLNNALKAKDWEAAKAAAQVLLDDITSKMPVDQMSGKTKDVYDKVVEVLANINAGKYDDAVETAQKVASWLPKKKAAADAAPELPAAAN